MGPLRIFISAFISRREWLSFEPRWLSLLYLSHIEPSEQTNKQPNGPQTSLSLFALLPLDSPRISDHGREPHELRHAPAFHTKPHHPHHAVAADTMESVIHEDSPLAEFLEGRHCTLRS